MKKIKEQIMEHLEMVNSMETAGIPSGFVKEYGVNACETAMLAILGCGIEYLVKHLPEKGREYLIKDPDVAKFLRKIQKKEELSIHRLCSLFLQAGSEKVSVLDWGRTEEVLFDEAIPENIQYPFLCFFKALKLSKNQLQQVCQSLEQYPNQTKIPLNELCAEERALLLEPLFTDDFLASVWADRNGWKALIKPGVFSVVQRIHEVASAQQELTRNQLFQIAEKPAEIGLLLSKVLTYFREEQYPQFCERWLENNALWADLKQMERLLPGITERQEILDSRIGYVCALYRAHFEKLSVKELNCKQEELILYALVYGKKHFLKLVDAQHEVFEHLPYHSMLLDKDVYTHYLNINAMNEKNLCNCRFLLEFTKKQKEYLNRPSYTFEELEFLLPLDPAYLYFYDLLELKRSDDRLRATRELTSQDYKFSLLHEEKIQKLAKRISQKPVSLWQQQEMGHIRELNFVCVLELLADWELYERFIPEIGNESQAKYLIRNQKIIQKYETLADFQKQMLQEDSAWLWLKKTLPLSGTFIQANEDRIRSFVSSGNAEIVYQFCQGAGNKWESVRRLLSAELMGEFHKLKYYASDLEQEIAYPLTKETEEIWQENLIRTSRAGKIWEEDRFIPVLQIGEIPIHTCLSYHDGAYKECLLSCFDSNKKVLYLEWGGKVVFRALLRLTKGSWKEHSMPSSHVEFADLTKEKPNPENIPEELILFLERPYFKGLNKKIEETTMHLVEKLVREKAKKLRARLVISMSYHGYQAFEDYKNREYYVYISASKNGSQYLDSLGGEAKIRAEGTYGKNEFLMMEEAIF